MDKSRDNPAEVEESITLSLRPKALAFIRDVRKRTGISRTEALSRFLDWAESLDQRLVTGVLVNDSTAKEELARAVMRDMLGGAMQPKSPAELAEQMHAMVDQYDVIVRGLRAEVERLQGSKPKKG